nr:rifin PIR protein,putative [Plasmodium sp. DRC-Itaito]
MKVHYINILLFALPLNILVYNQRNHKSMTPHTPKIPTTRLLCECEFYSPANYDSDPQIKKVMENFNKQTQQRFHEYDERMKTTRQKCKEQCDKEIQKIILKDKIEKELSEKFATLDTDIQSDDLPTCFCKKSLADKTEKFCLNYGKNMGAITPWWGLVCGSGYAGWTNYVTQMAIQKGIEEGVKYGFESLRDFRGLSGLIEVSKIQSLINPANYADPTIYATFVQDINKTKCVEAGNNTKVFCNAAQYQGIQNVSAQAAQIAEDAASAATLAEEEAMNAAAPTTNALTTTINASLIAIVVIVLIMLIIYLILRYRRKKKMKKKLQYIKLLEE